MTQKFKVGDEKMERQMSDGANVNEAIRSLLEAGGVKDRDRWVIRNRDGQLHREDGPAVIYPNGTQHWFHDGWLHREDAARTD